MFIFQFVFPCNSHLFDCLLLILHWYLFCFLFFQLWVNRCRLFRCFRCFARFVSVDSSRAAAFHRVVVEHSRSAEDETRCRRSSQDVSGNPPILCINQAITSRLSQAPGPPLSSRQHPVLPLSVSLDIFGCSVFRSRKGTYLSSTSVRDEGRWSSTENSSFS